MSSSYASAPVLGNLGAAGSFLEHSGPAKCQFKGKGDFEPVFLELQTTGALAVLGRKDNTSISTGSLATQCPELIGMSGVEARAPKSARKGHPNAFRIDVGGKKFVFSVTAALELEEWMGALKEGSGLARTSASSAGPTCGGCGIGQAPGYKFCTVS